MADQTISLTSMRDRIRTQTTTRRPRKNSCRLVGPIGDADQEAVRCFLRECLAPLFAEEFFRMRDAAAAKNTLQAETDFQIRRQGGGQTDRESH